MKPKKSREVYGCACCSGDFGRIFESNDSVRHLNTAFATRGFVEKAIRAMTSEAAWQLYSEHEVGSLEVGKFADMVILDGDPRKVAPDKIKDIRVLETWMDGKQVYAAV